MNPRHKAAIQFLKSNDRNRDAAATFVSTAASRLGWSSLSITDLAGAAQVDVGHAAEALQYRRALNGV